VLGTPELPFDPGTFRKGIVTSIFTTTTPPTISVTISGDTTVIDGVRFFDSYSPQVGQTVILGKQGSDIWGMGSIADLPAASGGGSWTDAVLGTGFAHDGNGNGTLQYRRVMDNGAWKMQWRGAVARTSGNLVLATALAAEYRPGSKRSVACARDVQGGSNVVVVDFSTSGTLDITGQTTVPVLANTVVTGTVGSTTATGTTASVDPVANTASAAISGTSSSVDPAPTTASAAISGTSSSVNPVANTASAAISGTSSSVDPVDTTTSTDISGTSSSVDPSDTTTSVVAGGTVSTENPGSVTSTVDPNDSTTTDSGHSHGVVGGHFHTFGLSHDHSFTGTAHSHGVTGSHSHTWSNSHSHGVTGEHAHTWSNSHTHSISGAHAHTWSNSHAHDISGAHAHTWSNSHTHSISGAHAHAFTGTSHSHTLTNDTHGHTVTVTAPVWISFNGLEYFL
jgi:hypothetical protein